jgi:hypothetical protein
VIALAVHIIVGIAVWKLGRRWFDSNLRRTVKDDTQLANQADVHRDGFHGPLPPIMQTFEPQSTPPVIPRLSALVRTQQFEQDDWQNRFGTVLLLQNDALDPPTIGLPAYTGPPPRRQPTLPNRDKSRSPE